MSKSAHLAARLKFHWCRLTYEVANPASSTAWCRRLLGGSWTARVAYELMCTPGVSVERLLRCRRVSVKCQCITDSSVISRVMDWSGRSKVAVYKTDTSDRATASRCRWPVSLFGQVGVKIFWFTHLADAAVLHVSHCCQHWAELGKGVFEKRRGVYD